MSNSFEINKETIKTKLPQQQKEVEKKNENVPSLNSNNANKLINLKLSQYMPILRLVLAFIFNFLFGFSFFGSNFI